MPSLSKFVFGLAIFFDVVRRLRPLRVRAPKLCDQMKDGAIRQIPQFGSSADDKLDACDDHFTTMQIIRVGPAQIRNGQQFANDVPLNLRHIQENASARARRQGPTVPGPLSEAPEQKHCAELA
jgi:hypothetical protein